MPSAGSVDRDQRIGVMRQQPGALVFVIVVDGQLPAVGIGQPQDRIQRRAELAGGDLGDDLLAGAAFDAENVDVARPVDAAVDDHRQRDRLGMGRDRRSVPAPGIRAANRERRGRNWRSTCCCGRRSAECPTPRPAASTVSAGAVQVAADQLDRGLLAGRAAQRENGGDVGQLAERDAVDEILAAAVERVADFQRVLPGLGNLAVEGRIGAEAVVVAVGQFVSPRNRESPRRLETSRARRRPDTAATRGRRR